MENTMELEIRIDIITVVSELDQAFNFTVLSCFISMRELYKNSIQWKQY